MTPEDVIRGFREGVEHTSEEKEYANTLFQEAIKIGMEINQTYHTPEELVKLMSKLTGRAVDKSFRLFPPFYTDFGKNIRITGRTIMLQLKLEIMYGLARMLQCYPVLPLENGQLLQPEQ